jgi:uncharacterized protein (DUF58 family)
MRGDYWLFISLLIMIISLVLHQASLLLISLLFLLAGGVSRLLNRFCLHRIEYRRRLSRNHVFFGEEIFFEVEVANRKPMPLPWLQIEDELPDKVTLLKGKTTAAHETRVILSNIFPINWYHRLKRRFPMRCQQRGCFVFGPTRIQSGDLFGFFRRDMYINEVNYLTVYPRLVPLEKLGIPSQQLFGDIRLRRHLFQDPVLTAGVRDYYFGDSFRRIHWMSTARLGKLQTKVYEPTTTVDLSIFLDVRTVRAPQWGVVTTLLELGIIAAASISQHALKAGYRVGLYVNQMARFARGLVRIPHSQHPDQLLHILEALAQLHEVESIPAHRFIRQEARNIPCGSTLVVISAQPADKLLATLLDLKSVGRSVVLIQVGGAALVASADNLPVYQIRDDIAWDMIEQISMKEA